MKMQGNSRIAAEVARFDAVGGEWWDEQGPFRPLHWLNPIRIDYIRAQANLAGQRVLDIACGGGLVCEPLARLGAQVTGIDTSAAAIAAAKAHGAAGGLKIDYRCCALEEFSESKKFDIITALEILEHVDQPDAFVARAVRLLKPNGRIIFSTINRTFQSLLVAKWGAEDVLRIVPRGTHDWQQFIQPAELASWAEAAGLRVANIQGLSFNPARAGTALFALSPNVSVNYFLTASA